METQTLVKVETLEEQFFGEPVEVGIQFVEKPKKELTVILDINTSKFRKALSETFEKYAKDRSKMWPQMLGAFTPFSPETNKAVTSTQYGISPIQQLLQHSTIYMDSWCIPSRRRPLTGYYSPGYYSRRHFSLAHLREVENDLE